MRSLAPLAAVLLMACGSPAASPAAPAASPPQTAAAASSAASSPPADAGKFVPDPPLVPPPTGASVAAAQCKIADVDLGPARDVVNAQESLYPVTTVFGPKGGLAVWIAGDKVALRALDSTAAPSGPMAFGPAWKEKPLAVALADGFVLLRVESTHLYVLRVNPDGRPAAPPSSLTLPVPAGLWFDFARSGEQEITLVTERERLDNGPINGDEILVTTVTLDGTAARAQQRSVAVTDIFSDSKCLPGTLDGSRALLIATTKKALTLVRGDRASPFRLADVAFDTKPHVEILPVTGGSNAGFAYGVVPQSRSPRMPFDDYPAPAKTRFELADPDWLGLDEVRWTGAVFLVARLSHPAPDTRARLFTIDCRKP